MIAAYSCERILNQVDLADNQLSLIQDQIYSALATNVWARALVGEAAYGLEGFTMMPLEMAELWFADANPRFPPESPRTLEYTLYSWSGLEATDRECYIDTMIQMQAAAKEELPRRLTLASNIAYEVSGGTNRMPFVKSLTRMLIPSIADGFYRDARSTATLRCGLAALAVERFRIAHDGKLPSGLAELVPQFLAAVPADPYDGKPLRFRPLAKGFVVYSLGEDADDDGGRPRKIGQKVAGDYDVTFRIER